MTEGTTVTEEALGTDEQGRTKHKGGFTFKVPEDHPLHKDDSGKVRVIKGEYDYVQCRNDVQAIATLKAEEWNITDMVNDELKGRARNNAHQKAFAGYKKSSVSLEQIRARLVLDMIRVGVPADKAEQTVAALPVKK